MIIAESFLVKSPSALILGDNIFYGHSFESQLTSVTKQQEGATIFAYHVNNPEQYGVAEFDARNRVIDIKEKPKNITNAPVYVRHGRDEPYHKIKPN